jgi:hypothetical protein
LVIALTLGSTSLSVVAWPPHPADAAIGQIFLPNITKTLGGAGGWTTPIVVQNTGDNPTDVTLTFYRFTDGRQIASTTMPMLKPGQSRSFDPRSDARLPEDTQFSTVVQAATGQVTASVLEGSGSSWMAYSGTPTGASTVYLPNITRNLGGKDGWNTPFIVQNLGTKAAIASVSFYNFDDGSLAKRVDNVAIQPGRSQAFLTWAIEGLADDRQFAVVVQGPADAQLYAVVNEVAGSMAMSYEGLMTGSDVVYLPNVLKYLGGSDHWFTPFVVQNIGSTPATFSIEFYSFETGRLVTTLHGQRLLPGRSLPVDVRFNPSTLPAGSYSVIVRGQPGAKLGAVVNEVDPGAGMAMSYNGVGKSEALATAFLPFLQKNTGSIGWFSPIIAQNLGAAPADLTLTLYDSNGDIATQKLYPQVKPGAAAVYDPRADRRIKDGTYSGIVQSSVPITAVVNIAGRLAGDYAMAVTSTAAPQRSVPHIPPAPPKTIGPYTLSLKASNSVDTYIENTIDQTAMTRIAAQVDADVVQIQRDFAREFRTIPTVYVFAAEASYAQGLKTLLGYAQATATDNAKRTTAMYSPMHNIVLANWDDLSKDVPLSVFRHELTHLMLRQIVGANPTVPAWLDEGLAVNEELTLSGTKWIAMLTKYRTAAMAASKKLIPLQELDSPIAWGNRPSPSSYYQYAEAQQAVEMLRTDIGQSGINRILDLLAKGETFAGAYALVAGKPFAEFAALFPTRVGGSTAGPQIVAVDDSPIGPGLTYFYFGFAPLALVTLDIRSSTVGSARPDLTDLYGAEWGYLAPGWPAGQYSLSVTNGAQSASTIARKPV